MMNIGKLCSLIAIVMIAGVGCGVTQDADVSTIIVTKSTEIVQVLVEDFDDLTYSAVALENMIQEEIQEYHEREELNTVTLDELLVENKIVKLKMTYASANDYMGFNSILLFVGGISEALEKGYILDDTTLVSADNQESYTKAQIQEMEGIDLLTVLVVDEVVGIRVPKSIQYYSKGLELSGDMDIVETESMTRTVVIY